ncbi:hypothetical protein, partial [Hwanghaeella sp. LZ110]|uniref:hypothetical protein n=1 Tax=Hwanghaeella sp. LZ110 TaxID=3402810 RepID=UPI003B6737EC
PDALLKNGKVSYGIDGNSKRFFWASDSSYMMLDGHKSLFKQRHLIFEKNFSNMKANTILDLVWRLHLISSGFVLIHAAAISKNEKGILLPAWK